MKYLILALLGLSASAHATRLGAKVQVNEAPPKIWVVDIKDDKTDEAKTDGKLTFRFRVAPEKKHALIHLEIEEAGEKGGSTQLAKMDVKAKWGQNAEVIEAVNGYALHLWLRPTKK